MSALSDIHTLAGQISVWLNTSGIQCRLAGVRQPSSLSATTWRSVCISASFFIFDWLNCDFRATERSAASLITISEQLTEPAETQLMYPCVWIWCQDEVSVNTKIMASWSIQPFGHNRHGPKIEGAVPPFWGGGAGFPSSTMWPGPRPISKPSGILIHPTVWPQ